MRPSTSLIPRKGRGWSKTCWCGSITAWRPDRDEPQNDQSLPAPFPLLRCYRLTRRRYEVLDGEGARRVGGRWNSPGRAAIYAAEEPSLTVLETLVHLDLTPELLPDDYVIFE